VIQEEVGATWSEQAAIQGPGQPIQQDSVQNLLVIVKIAESCILGPFSSIESLYMVQMICVDVWNMFTSSISKQLRHQASKNDRCKPQPPLNLNLWAFVFS
jgi:hypothetical protein